MWILRAGLFPGSGGPGLKGLMVEHLLWVKSYLVLSSQLFLLPLARPCSENKS